MVECLKPEDWLSTIQKEYLKDFVKEGGAAVKFVVPMEGTDFSLIKTGLQRLAKEEQYRYFFIDATAVKIHLIEQIFFQIAKELDWENLALVFLRSLLQDHYRLPENKTDFTLQQIALLNGYQEQEIRIFINNRLRESLFRNYALAQEFRIAMLMLCRYQLDSAEISADLHAAILAWLRGELRLISSLKRALIFQKIGRHNARSMLFSLVHWLKLGGASGVVLALDITRYLQDRSKDNPSGLYYSVSAMLDCYELLRQLVDGTDESEYLFSVVLASSRFLDEGDRRSVNNYEALKLRIWNEVHDRKYLNPLASLVRVSCCQGS
jgi:hypothetical protein